MGFFYKPVKETKKNMLEFLLNHRFYGNQFSNLVKLHSLGLSSEELDKAYELYGTEFYIEDLTKDIIFDFERKNEGYSLSFTGRSGGHLILIGKNLVHTNFNSHCLSCGQKNFQKVLNDDEFSEQEKIIAHKVMDLPIVKHDLDFYLLDPDVSSLNIEKAEKIKLIEKYKAIKLNHDASFGNRCGRCGATGENGRVNYLTRPLKAEYRDLKYYQSDLEYFDKNEVLNLFRLVRDFDKTCDKLRENLIKMTKTCKVVEKTRTIEKKYKVIECID